MRQGCASLAPEVIQVGDDRVSLVIDPEGPDDEHVLDVARACPAHAGTLIDEFEGQMCSQQSVRR